MTKPFDKSQGSAARTLAAGQQSMTAFKPMQKTALTALADLGTATMNFVASRMQRDLETQKAILACRSLEDMQKVQAEYYKKMLEDFGSEMARMMQAMSTATTQSAGLSTRREYDDIPI